MYKMYNLYKLYTGNDIVPTWYYSLFLIFEFDHMYIFVQLILLMLSLIYRPKDSNQPFYTKNDNSVIVFIQMIKIGRLKRSQDY